LYDSPEEAREFTYFFAKDWLAEKHSRGCYVGVPPAGALTAFGEALRDPVGRIHFAGTETATVWPGYMEGAVQAGERVASEILARM